MRWGDVMNAPRQISLRGPSEALVKRLRAVAEERGQSMNTTILQLLEEAVGIHGRDAALAAYTTWSEADQHEFEASLAEQRTIDPEMWALP